MGIKGLLKLVSDNEKEICTEERQIVGELIVDGYGILHQLYVKHGLDWANGGCYSRQHKVTVDYFEAMLKEGVRPIVVVDGGGCEKQHSDTVHRRGKDIADIPKQLEQHHDNTQSSHAHLLPILARQVFMSSLQEMKIDVCVADGKATRTIVLLAKYYRCPVLTNSSNYCVCGVEGGVIFFEHFDENTCKAIIYEQWRLIKFCRLGNPDLVYAIVALMGDGNVMSVPYSYHGKVRTTIEAYITGKVLYGRSPILNIADFLRIKKIGTFDAFKHDLESFAINWGDKLHTSCLTAEKTYNYSSANAVSLDNLKVSTSIESLESKGVPVEVLEAYRNGTFPVLALNAMTIGKCVLEQVVGDLEQDPPPVLARHVRQFIYGLVPSTKIIEYHRSITGGLKYEPHEVAPQLMKHQDLTVTNIYGMDKAVREHLAMRTICEILKCPDDIVHELESKDDRSLTLVTLVTRYWSSHITEKEPIPNPSQLISALVINFFFDLAISEPENYRQLLTAESRFSDPYWMKVYHALLEWQNLYSNVCSLNAMVCQPLASHSPRFLFDGLLVFFLALHPSPDIIKTYVDKLDHVRRLQYEKVMALVL
jgi:hypothetical protein